MKLVLLISAFLISTSVFSQASWTYHWKFKLMDVSGKIYDADRIKSENVHFFVLQNGGHSNAQLSFSKSKKEFNFSQHTITTDVSFVMVQGKDTMVIESSTHNMEIGNIRIENGVFKLPYWASKNDFNCTNFERECVLKKSLNSFKKSNKTSWIPAKVFPSLIVNFQ